MTDGSSPGPPQPHGSLQDAAAVELPAIDTEPVLMGRPQQGDGTCRGGYGAAVLARFGNQCVYCDLDFTANYESWLHMSVDHIVPRQSAKSGYPTEWLEDLLNHAPCCRTCNEFLNQYKVALPEPPATLAGFVQLRDRVKHEKRELAAQRHAVERERFEKWSKSASSAGQS